MLASWNCCIFNTETRAVTHAYRTSRECNEITYSFQIDSNFYTHTLSISFGDQEGTPWRWNRTDFQTCSKCNKEYAPKNFAYGTLASLEKDGQSFLAVCLHCNPVMDKTHASLAPVTCVLCKTSKERKEFRLERRRNSTLVTRGKPIRSKT